MPIIATVAACQVEVPRGWQEGANRVAAWEVFVRQDSKVGSAQNSGPEEVSEQEDGIEPSFSITLQDHIEQ